MFQLKVEQNNKINDEFVTDKKLNTKQTSCLSTLEKMEMPSFLEPVSYKETVEIQKNSKNLPNKINLELPSDRNHKNVSSAILRHGYSVSSMKPSNNIIKKRISVSNCTPSKSNGNARELIYLSESEFTPSSNFKSQLSSYYNNCKLNGSDQSIYKLSNLRNEDFYNSSTKNFNEYNQYLNKSPYTINPPKPYRSYLDTNLNDFNNNFYTHRPSIIKNSNHLVSSSLQEKIKSNHWIRLKRELSEFLSSLSSNKISVLLLLLILFFLLWFPPTKKIEIKSTKYKLLEFCSKNFESPSCIPCPKGAFCLKKKALCLENHILYEDKNGILLCKNYNSELDHFIHIGLKKIFVYLTKNEKKLEKNLNKQESIIKLYNICVKSLLAHGYNQDQLEEFSFRKFVDIIQNQTKLDKYKLKYIPNINPVLVALTNDNKLHKNLMKHQKILFITIIIVFFIILFFKRYYQPTF